ncbi:DinB family protein [Falsibacillus pallidus]|uniref:DinB family protein n=1 Tax=Falsibacillus pallidus TaxID=493781 RepID=A0A370GD86_9BACI|nr:DinB family protein [Falsibacillus pallidus]RDI39933.1 DinB family protein [Falsibacillus pallidus]
MNKPPVSGDYIPYYSTYIERVEAGEIEEVLSNQIQVTVGLLKDLSEEQGAYRYGDGKWSIKEVIGHMADTERVMNFRLMSFARGESSELPGFDENEYVARARFDRQSIPALLENLAAVRSSTISLLENLDEEAWERSGTANGAPVTVKALAWIIAGHELHHCMILKERYFGAESFPKK